MIKTIIFDFDGTIADTLPYSWKRIVNYLKKENITDKANEEIIEDIRTKSYQELFKHFKISWLKIPLILFEIDRAQKDLFSVIDTIKPYKGMAETLQKLKEKGYKLGILSSNLKKNIDKFITTHNFYYFDFIYCQKNLFGKASKLQEILKQRHLTKDEAVYVADEARDIEACKKTGIKIISVTWGLNNRKLLAKYQPEWLINKPEEIINTLSNF